MSELLPAPRHRLSWRQPSWNCWRRKPRTRSCQRECPCPSSSQSGSAHRWSQAGTAASGPDSWSTNTRWRSSEGTAWEKNRDWSCTSLCFPCRTMDAANQAINKEEVVSGPDWFFLCTDLQFVMWTGFRGNTWLGEGYNTLMRAWKVQFCF